jgi:hypothetical protein
MIRQQLKRLAKIEASQQVGLQAPLQPSRDEWAAMNTEEVARCYFDFVNAPMSPAMAVASRASIAGISPAVAAATYERVMRAAA